MLPKDWKPFLLGELMTFRNGLNFTQADTGEKIKIVGVADFQSHTKLKNSSELSVVTVSGKVAEVDLLQSGDLLFVRSNGNKALIGRCLYFPHVVERMSFSGFTIRGRANIERLNPEFASYLMRSPHVTSQMHLGGSGTNINNLSQEVLNGIKISVPNLDEQRDITEVLRSWDDAIETVKKILANSCKQKQGLMCQLLSGSRRLLGQNSCWKTYQLGKLFTERVEVNKCNLPLLSVTRDEGVIPRKEVGRKDTSNEDKSLYQRVCPGDIAYNTMRMWQGVSALSSYEGLVSPAYTVITPRDLIDGQFAAYLFKYKPVVFLFYRYSQGLVSDTWNLKFPQFSKIEVSIPEKTEQQAIAKVLKDADREITAYEQVLAKLQEEKNALMVDLLTGKRRICHPVSSPEPLVA